MAIEEKNPLNRALNAYGQRERARSPVAATLGASPSFEMARSAADEPTAYLRDDLTRDASVRRFVERAHQQFAEAALAVLECSVEEEGDRHLLFADPTHDRAAVRIGGSTGVEAVEVRMEAIPGTAVTTCIRTDTGPVRTRRTYEVEYEEVLFVLTLPDEHQVEFRDAGVLGITTDGIDAIGVRHATLDSTAWTSDLWMET